MGVVSDVIKTLKKGISGGKQPLTLLTVIKIIPT